MVIETQNKSKKYPTKKSLKNLIPVTMRSKEEARKISSLGGRGNKNNPKSKLAARLREMKKNGLSSDNERWLHDMMTDSEMAAFQILDFIKKNLAATGKPAELNQAVKTAMDWYKIKHGTKENDMRTMAVVVHLTPEEKEDEIGRLLL